MACFLSNRSPFYCQRSWLLGNLFQISCDCFCFAIKSIACVRLPTCSRGFLAPEIRSVGQALTMKKPHGPPWSTILIEQRVKFFADNLNTRGGIYCKWQSSFTVTIYCDSVPYRSDSLLEYKLGMTPVRGMTHCSSNFFERASSCVKCFMLNRVIWEFVCLWSAARSIPSYVGNGKQIINSVMSCEGEWKFVEKQSINFNEVEAFVNS